MNRRLNVQIFANVVNMVFCGCSNAMLGVITPNMKPCLQRSEKVEHSTSSSFIQKVPDDEVFYFEIN